MLEGNFFCHLDLGFLVINWISIEFIIIILLDLWCLVNDTFLDIFVGCEASLARKDKKESASIARFWQGWIVKGKALRSIILEKACVVGIL